MQPWPQEAGGFLVSCVLEHGSQELALLDLGPSYLQGGSHREQIKADRDTPEDRKTQDVDDLAPLERVAGSTGKGRS